ncbi:23S rRNA (guanosine(2251)-2'-O)-methyltransferase RlmB [Synechococcus sp. RSCCF101]|uniref:23S rRNA (guanosine(2251)-2'-O)-methyltransferase RlmB n=1 Tax=Synechococcus sp. RSCCF101 TaxID=2511069 RepID=UPI00124492C1|nr:23S rRNA (guanosine(2251)-2'-O)-methyltransferase RlmB [Synechococcus sp. RSCCF101]QEY31491.1 23S rRNA (guanosine(2251)-2'-O)-methyltransferase RlmB [Synechococcus sp. RSCCF101]
MSAHPDRRRKPSRWDGPRQGPPREGPPREGRDGRADRSRGGGGGGGERYRRDRGGSGERAGGSDRFGSDRFGSDRPRGDRFRSDRPRTPRSGPEGRRFESRRFEGRRPDSRRFDGRRPDTRHSQARASLIRRPGADRTPERNLPAPTGEAERFSAEATRADDILWGRHAVQAALESGRPIHRIWCTGDIRSSGRFLQLLRDAKSSGVLVEEVSWARLGQITSGAVHQGIALQTAAAECLDLPTLIEACGELGEPPLLMAVDGLTDPHNLGAIMRSAEAFGAHGMVLPQRRAAGLTGSVAKVAAGALEHLPVARVVNLNRSLESLKQAGYRVIGLAEEGQLTLAEADLDGPLVVVTGSEESGLSLLTRRHCDQLVRIPLRGVTPSLNASVATAIVVYEVARRGWMRGLSGQARAPRINRPKVAAPNPPAPPEPGPGVDAVPAVATATTLSELADGSPGADAAATPASAAVLAEEAAQAPGEPSMEGAPRADDAWDAEGGTVDTVEVPEPVAPADVVDAPDPVASEDPVATGDSVVAEPAEPADSVAAEPSERVEPSDQPEATTTPETDQPPLSGAAPAQPDNPEPENPSAQPAVAEQPVADQPAADQPEPLWPPAAAESGSTGPFLDDISL